MVWKKEVTIWPFGCLWCILPFDDFYCKSFLTICQPLIPRNLLWIIFLFLCRFQSLCQPIAPTCFSHRASFLFSSKYWIRYFPFDDFIWIRETKKTPWRALQLFFQYQQYKTLSKTLLFRLYFVFKPFFSFLGLKICPKIIKPLKSAVENRLLSSYFFILVG